jgi:hypothetical protein
MLKSIMLNMDPVLPLAFSMHSGPGVYALLLGSGVSRGAGLPTGWEVTLDLFSKLATAVGEGEEAEADPAAWYRLRYKEEPDYSRVVDYLSATPAARPFSFVRRSPRPPFSCTCVGVDV